MNKKEKNQFYWVAISVWTLFAIAGWFTKNQIPLIYVTSTTILYYLIFHKN